MGYFVSLKDGNVPARDPTKSKAEGGAFFGTNRADQPVDVQIIQPGTEAEAGWLF